jgi:dihydrodipicolinate synthase/N-acetylneuraminate lyase
MLESLIAGQLRAGVAIPASPLALDANRKLDERRQRGLYRYYAAASAGGIAVGVHTTQFAIRDAKVGLLEPVLRIAREEMDRADEGAGRPLIRVAGICGGTRQAVGEAELARDCGYHLGLLSLAAMKGEDEQAIVSHCRAVAEVIPVVGFYLQPAVGGRTLTYSFWRKFCEIENVAAIKIAPFNRYQTLDVVRAVVESGRDDIALYTGNDDNIVADLVTRFGFVVDGKKVERRIVGGLLGHWSVWTSGAVRLLRECQAAGQVSDELLARGVAVTDSNAAFFDAANGFMGCIAGLHEVLRRQGLLEGIWCLDPQENLSPGQLAEIDRVYGAYPELNDDAFVAKHLDEWLRG